MTPFASLLVGLWGFVLVVSLGYIYEWPFLAGIAVAIGGVVALVIWAFDGMGRAVDAMTNGGSKP